ncbi:MAG: hypothetical protein AAGI48_05810 [Verrucomicrobiota bacterium]
MSHNVPYFAAVFAAISGLLPASGAVHAGPDARDLFNSFGGQSTDFSGVSGPFTSVPGLLGATFETTRDRSFFNDTPAILPVFAETVAPGDIAIIGTRDGGFVDAQSLYQIRFDDPQLFAGLDRRWNTNSLTHFYNGSTLLYSHQNSENTEFVGWVGDINNLGTWVDRIVIDGQADPDTPPPGQPRGLYQTGRADNLFFGVPEPATTLYGAAGLALLARRRRA